jgi:lysophospholipase L1-like esterase
MRPVRALVVGVVLLSSMLASPAVAGASEEPTSLASIGDSITRGTNAFGWYGDHPSLSWSTGFNPADGFDSHYERLFLDDPAIWGDELNVARAGATMADAPGQAAEVVRDGADYVTILMGANDVCARSADAMTPVGSFAGDFERTLSTLDAGLPGSRILVASIPNIERLATVYGDDLLARVVWHEAGICPSVLAPTNTWTDRLDVTLREAAYNLVLQGVCARFANCRFDGFAVYEHAFDRHEVSTLDFFHPSVAGQRALAALTWSHGWWPSA